MGMFLTDADCIRQREYVNIPAWHKSGYKGKGLNIFCDDVSGNHVESVADIIQTILPEAKIYTGNIGYIEKGGVISQCSIRCNETGETIPFDDFIKKYSIDLINNSTDGGNGDTILPVAQYMKGKIKEHNLIFSGSAGNGYEQPTKQKYNGACIVVTSANLESGKAVYGKDSTAPNIDFAIFHGFQSGSSFASPFLLGMAGLLRCKYPHISQDEVYEYFRGHCEDIGTPGKDSKSGWGVPILGNPNSTKIVLQVGNSVMIVDGKEVQLDQPPIIDKNTWRTLVPVKAIVEAFGATVDWNEDTKTIVIER